MSVQKQDEPSKQCVQTLHLGSPMAFINVSSELNFSDVSPKRSRIISTIFSYSGEPVVAYFSEILVRVSLQLFDYAPGD